MKTKVAIIGGGNVGSALQRGLQRAGHETRVSKRDTVHETAQWGEVIIVAVPFPAVPSVVEQVGADADGKLVIDVTNALTKDMAWAVGFSTSGAEQLQRLLKKSQVVKCFNTVFAQHMDTGKLMGRALTVFAAGDDAASRKKVLALASEIGFDAVDAGPLERARGLEALGFFNIQLGYVQNMGTDIGFNLIHK